MRDWIRQTDGRTKSRHTGDMESSCQEEANQVPQNIHVDSVGYLLKRPLCSWRWRFKVGVSCRRSQTCCVCHEIKVHHTGPAASKNKTTRHAFVHPEYSLRIKTAELSFKWGAVLSLLKVCLGTVSNDHDCCVGFVLAKHDQSHYCKDTFYESWFQTNKSQHEILRLAANFVRA